MYAYHHHLSVNGLQQHWRCVQHSYLPCQNWPTVEIAYRWPHGGFDEEHHTNIPDTANKWHYWFSKMSSCPTVQSRPDLSPNPQNIVKHILSDSASLVLTQPCKRWRMTSLHGPDALRRGGHFDRGELWFVTSPVQISPRWSTKGSMYTPYEKGSLKIAGAHLSWNCRWKDHNWILKFGMGGYCG